jgi:O-antigen biosynthesis protein
MPYLSGVLNALRRRARGFGPPRPGERLDPRRFLAHAEALAQKAPPPQGLWLSLIADGPSPRRFRGWPRTDAAELIVCDSSLQDPAARWMEALERARAPFVLWIDGEGRPTRFGLERIAAALAAHPHARALYADELVATPRGRPAGVVLKPAFDPVLLAAFDYIGRPVVFRRDRALALGGFDEGDRALALRLAAEAAPGEILHLPYPAWIGPPRPAARAVPEGAARRGPWPKVGVVIPSRDAPDLIGAALAGLFARTDYPDFDVTIVDNGTSDPRTLALYRAHAGPRFRVATRPEPFNFSRAVNRGAALTDAPLLLLLNNDVEVIEPGWLKEMVACLDRPDVGIVGAKLLYPDGTLQHAGVIAGLGGYAGHWHLGRPESEPGPQGRLHARQSLSVVTGACMLVTRACFEAVRGFDEETFPIAYNDVDFCLRAGAAGYRVVWTPFARLVHHESASRGSDETPENRARFARDKAALRERHRTDILEDRAYNPWAVRDSAEPWPAARADLPKARA